MPIGSCRVFARSGDPPPSFTSSCRRAFRAERARARREFIANATGVPMQSQMRKLKYHVATTLDGFIAREDDSFDFFPRLSPEHEMDYFRSLLSEYDTVL